MEAIEKENVTSVLKSSGSVPIKKRQPELRGSAMPITDVIASYGRCCVHPAFFDRFYEIFLGSDPAIRPMFVRTNFAKQKALLRGRVDAPDASGGKAGRDHLS